MSTDPCLSSTLSATRRQLPTNATVPVLSCVCANSFVCLVALHVCQARISAGTRTSITIYPNRCTDHCDRPEDGARATQVAYVAD